MPARRTKPPLRVVVNPFVVLDHEGRPAAAVAFDSGDKFVGRSRRWIGAAPAHEVIEKRDPIVVGRGPNGRPVISGDGRPSLHDVWFAFAPDPIVVPDTRAHRRALDPARGGQPPLLPADAQTAARLGLPFVAPALIVYETARVGALRHHADHGELPEWVSGIPGLLGSNPAVADLAYDPEHGDDAVERRLASLHASHAVAARLLHAHLGTILAAHPRAVATETGAFVPYTVGLGKAPPARPAPVPAPAVLEEV